jgi:mono/diheme cytochrome c family protein
MPRTFLAGSAGMGLRIVLALVAAAYLVPASAQLPRNGRPQRPTVTLPDGPVRQVILRSCTACHGIDEYGYYAMDRPAWHALVERMKVTKSGVVEGAVISEADQEILLDWLVAEFGPDATPFERQYVLPELTAADLLSDGEARALLTRACASCHASIEAIVDRPLDDGEWRRTLTGKIATGAPILVDEIDPLIEWLTRERRVSAPN